MLEDMVLRRDGEEDVQGDRDDEYENEIRVENVALAFGLIERPETLDASLRLVLLLQLAHRSQTVRVLGRVRLVAAEQTHQCVHDWRHFCFDRLVRTTWLDFGRCRRVVQLHVGHYHRLVYYVNQVVLAEVVRLVRTLVRLFTRPVCRSNELDVHYRFFR